MAASVPPPIEEVTFGAFFARLDLVTREEFDVQRQVLLRTREKLERLEAKLTEIEQRERGRDT